MSKPQPKLYGIYNEGDVVTDTEVWGNKKFILQSFHGNDYCPCFGARAVMGRPHYLNLDPRNIELRNATHRPLRKVGIVALLKMKGKKIREAEREWAIRNNNRKLQ